MQQWDDNSFAVAVLKAFLGLVRFTNAMGQKLFENVYDSYYVNYNQCQLSNCTVNEIKKLYCYNSFAWLSTHILFFFEEHTAILPSCNED